MTHRAIAQGKATRHRTGRCVQANHDELVNARGWSTGEYEAWLASTLVAALLADA